MDQAESLDALSNLLNDLSSNPYDLSLHIKHIQLASATGLDDQVDAARQMLTNFFPAPEEVWVPLLEAKEQSADLETVEGVEEVLALYSRAEADYLSIQILRKHIDFLIGRHAHFAGPDSVNEPLKELFATEQTLSAISSVVARGVGHLSESHVLWDAQRDWETELLENASELEKPALAAHLEALFLTRLQQPHSNHDETFSSYSTFTTNYKPAKHYESLLVTASKKRAQSVKAFQRRESFENQLAQSKFSLSVYAQYISHERRPKSPDALVLSTLYERAIAEAARRRFAGEVGADQMLTSFWLGYCDFQRVDDTEDDSIQLATLRRAVRCIPGSGEIWARYIRFLERTLDDAPEEEGEENKESVADAYARALSTNVIQKDVEQIVPLVLARAGFEKRQIETSKAGEDAFANLVQVLEDGVAMVRKASRTGDARFRLEKYASEIYLSLAGLPEKAIAIWQATAKHCKTSYLAWISYTDILIKHDQHAQARAIFKDIHSKNLDWPEAIWEAWLSFEHLYGSVQDIEDCMDKVERAKTLVNIRRAREAEKASYQVVQMAVDQPAASVPVQDAVQPEKSGEVETSMEVDQPQDVGAGKKRKAEESPAPEGSKKVKIGEISYTNPYSFLSSDREHCTVFVAELPLDVTEAELTSMFKDCGKIREIKITSLPNAMVATVEFNERDSVPAALTKDKKRIRGVEIAVHMAWQSTLYVANFPETADDAFIRNMFGKASYGLLFDVRWPSKKFKNTRRFVYVQYTSPSSAKAALELNGQELEPGHRMNVYISNPERKKERTDADANAREIYVAGLSRFTTKDELEKLFKTYGPVKEVRLAQDQDGKSKGFAFVEFELENDAQKALNANNYELKNRRIAVTLADTRVRSKPRNDDTGLGRQAAVRNRSVRIRNLPPGSQEGLLQQTLEKFVKIQRVEVFLDINEAVAELVNPAEAGKLLLIADPIVFGENVLQISEDTSTSRPGAPPGKAGGLFVPRAAVSRPKAGLGKSRKQPGPGATTQSAPGPSGTSQAGKAQDDFRKMLGGV
ncbi:hypothetical protein JAAARDRAFT_121734 [Jaapia argillacea MUCL 33604]|uniref:RRM domain-containing protein n=1 Tax=Jaapia argillacea MUCL 33604 TaxID=933084 RepID=A0A067Q8R0_9AGAM|nr:hypothetical protein JAAARDRAFT_121734 [Jaapia argillacea MUCL 33604]